MLWLNPVEVETVVVDVGQSQEQRKKRDLYGSTATDRLGDEDASLRVIPVDARVGTGTTVESFHLDSLRQ